MSVRTRVENLEKRDGPSRLWLVTEHPNGELTGPDLVTGEPRPYTAEDLAELESHVKANGGIILHSDGDPGPFAPMA